MMVLHSAAAAGYAHGQLQFGLFNAVSREDSVLKACSTCWLPLVA